MKRVKTLLLVATLVLSMVVCAACSKDSGGSSDKGGSSNTGTTNSTNTSNSKIKIGVVNNPPSESGYREANVKDMETVFSEANGYDLKTFYSQKNDDQLQAAQGFITEGVDYLLVSAAETTGWDDVLKNAKEAGVKVFIFARMLNVDESLYEAAVVSDMAIEGDTAVKWLLDQNLPVYNVIHIQGAMGSDAQIGRTGALDAQFASGKMNKVVQQTATWDEAEAKKIVESVINSKADFNVIYAENDGMAKGAVAALDENGITHGVDGKVIVMGFDCNRWALRELLAGKWNYDGHCSPFQAQVISDIIQGKRTVTDKIIYSVEKGFDAKTLTQSDIDTYGLGD